MKKYLLAFVASTFIATGCNAATQVVPLPPSKIENYDAKPVGNVPAPAKPMPVAPPTDVNPKSSISIQIQSPLIGGVGQEFVAVFVASGGSEPYTWRVAKGSLLPPGLSLEPILVIPDCAPPAPPEKPNCRPPYNDPTSIKITGTSTESGSFPITLSTTDSSNHPRSISALLTIK